MKVAYTTPANAHYWTDCYNMTQGAHLLIAGATGSGKSVLLNSCIYSLIGVHSPATCKFVLIDPKRVELSAYKKLPHTEIYAQTTAEYIKALKLVAFTMEARFSQMERAGIKEYNGAHIYVIVDELADIMTNAKKEAFPLLLTIAQLGRAARIHLIACTQSPSRKTIPAELTLNFTNKVALRCDSPIESRQVILVNGAEQLPAYGYALWRSVHGLQMIAVPMTKDEDITNRIAWWLSNHQKKTRFLSLFKIRSKSPI